MRSDDKERGVLWTKRRGLSAQYQTCASAYTRLSFNYWSGPSLRSRNSWGWYDRVANSVSSVLKILYPTLRFLLESQSAVYVCRMSVGMKHGLVPPACVVNTPLAPPSAIMVPPILEWNAKAKVDLYLQFRYPSGLPRKSPAASPRSRPRSPQSRTGS